MRNKFTELLDEFKNVFSGSGARIIDSLAPLFAFVLLQPWLELNIVLTNTIGLAIALSLLRLAQKKSLRYAFAGLGGVLLAGLFVKLSGSAAGFFLPGLVFGAVTVAVCILSVAVNRPLAAWSSMLTRRWPAGWYWHPQVLPAYREVTLFWAAAFGARLLLEWRYYQQAAVELLAASRVYLGWPFIIVLLVLSYLYGVWRLGRLQGPGVDEYRAGAPAPWHGQQKGF